MAIYMIGYDLHGSSEHDYEKLFAALEVIGTGYWDCLELTWLVIAERTAAELRDELRRYLGENDRLLVMGFGEGAAWLGFDGQCETWLEDNLGVSANTRAVDGDSQSYCGA